MSQVLYLDDADFPKKPVICYGTEKLIRAYTGNCMRIRNFADSLNHEVPFETNGSITLATHVTPYVGSGPNDAATVTVWYDQTTSLKNATKSSYRAPKIKDKLMGAVAGAKPAIIFEGGTQQGKAYGLDIDFNGIGLGGPNAGFTVFAVIRPTSSSPRNQNVTPNFSDCTFLEIDNTIPVTTTGTITAGAFQLTVADASNIFTNMWCQGPAYPSGALVTGRVGNVVSISGLAAVNSTGNTYKFSNVFSRLYTRGYNSPGGFRIEDRLNAQVAPNNRPLEMGPSVVCWQQGSNVTELSVGTRIFQNDRVSTSTLISSKLLNGFYGFLGASGTTLDIGGGTSNEILAAGQNGAGDFWISALAVYNTVLTTQERAYVTSALYDRFLIKPDRSKISKTTVWSVGDSIGAGYVCLGVDGMFNVVEDSFSPGVRVYNYCIAGQQTGPDVSIPGDNTFSSKGMLTNAVVPIMSKNPSRSLVVIQGGGNDMVSTKTTMADNVTPFAFVSFAGAGTITTTANHGLVVGGRVVFPTFSGGTGVTPNTAYWVKTTPGGATFTISASPGGATITFTGTPVATMNSLPKTATSIFTDTLSMVTESYANGAERVFVCKLTPRVGTEYNFILDDYNTQVAAGAGAGNYTVIDLFSIFPNQDNPDGNVDLVNFADSGHLNRVGNIAAGNAIITAITPFI